MAIPAVGIDFGTQCAAAAIARRGGIDVVLNESNYRLTEALVSFGPKERFLGTLAAGQLIMNCKNTVYDFKRLLGRKFKEQDAQEELQRLLCKSRELPDGSIGIDVTHKGEPHTFTPEQITAMYFGKLKSDIEREIGGKFQDCVISCPGWWSDAQRNALISAAQVAGLNVLRLIHETTATALQYCIFKQDLPEKDPQNVMFIDMGHSQLAVCIAAVTKKEMRIVSAAYDSHLGGRNFDDILVDHFTAEFQQKFKIDVRTNPRALLRLRSACEKLKKVLSANPEAPIAIECLMNDVDVRGFMKREQFEQLAKPLLERVAQTIMRCLAEASMTHTQINSVEIVGGALRIPMVQRVLQESLGHDLARTQNAAESVVRGCVLAAAAKSVGSRVKEVKVQDLFPYSIRLSPGPNDGAPVEIPRDGIFPSQVTYTYSAQQSFTLTTEYADPSRLPPGTSAALTRWTIVLPPSDVTRNVKVTLGLNDSGLLRVESANYAEETTVIEPAPTPAAAPATPEKMDTGDAKPDAAAAAAPAAPPPEPKKKVITTIHNLTVRVESSTAPSAQTVKQWTEDEARMAAEDRLFIDTAERRNALESYVLTFRSRLAAEYAPYSTAEQKTEVNKQLDENETWLNDAPDDTAKSVYVDRLTKLERLCEPIVQRYRDFTDALPDAFSTLRSTLSTATAQASSTDAKYDHITEAEREPLRKEIAAASAWLTQQEAVVASAPRIKSSPVTVDEVRKRTTALNKVANDVMGKAKPPPPKKEEEKKPAATDGAAPSNGAAPAADASKENSTEQKQAPKTPEKEKPAHTQMDIDA